MIIVSEKRELKVQSQMKGGTGDVHFAAYAPTPHCRMLGEVTMEKGCGSGYHTHEHECEVMYFISGEGVYNDNGTESIVRPGDAAYCMSGEGHCIRNEKDETLKFFAMVITEAP